MTGDRIATLTGNSSDHVVVFFACAKAGLVLVPLSWRLSPRELAAQLELADPQLLLVEDELDSLAAGACALLPHRPRTAALGPGGVEKSVPPPSRAGRHGARFGRRPARTIVGLTIAGLSSRGKSATTTRS